ncbi:DNA binding,ATP binding, putative isoform 1 [Cucumis melo var. makuwa]|uniref:Sacsin/Nov domain-containing protein n=2 Tax=Cucumis melo TaxID=3656 RepID=A0A9I9DZS8_CUCME|nr:DNA binding,ATP binding, putative isoform 1 [Cucumis melo var. makuwa]
MDSLSPKQHIQEIRRSKFSIGGPPNPLTEDLHQAVRNLSAELYTKDVHFLMELIQNAEDNEYSTSVKPSLEFIITSRDVTGSGAGTTLLIFNNEIGFSSKNIDSICSVGRSTKKNNRERGYIGEKGIGFKSVFLITSQPYIFSNGYQIRFNEQPCPHCGVGFVVPEWVEENPILSNIKEIYGRQSVLPTTTIVLPLKADKIKPVKQQLSNIHPEVLLFLSKIKQLSVREVNEDPKSNTVNAISISSETNFVSRKNIDAESYTLHLSSEESVGGSQCSYYMWKQKFPVKPENKVERRMGVGELVIILAFPNGQRLNRGVKSPGVYAFLPTEMITNFPFIIQSDFVLSSSRETILLDNKWNQGILDCVPSAFVNAFVSLVKNTDEAPLSSLAPMFNFLPTISSSYDKLNVVRDLIKENLLQQNIVPSHSFLKQRFFHKPREVGRLMPAFWNILMKAHTQGVSLRNLSSHGKHVLSYSLDSKEYDQALSFLDVKLVVEEWYAKCLQGTNMVEGVSDDLYLELLQFVAENWSSRFHVSSMKNVPLIRYVNLDGNVSLCSLNASTQNGGRRVYLAHHGPHLSWLCKSNMEFKSVSNCYFMPESTHKSIRSCPRNKDMLLQWLRDQVKVDTITTFQFAKLLVDSLGNNPKDIITYFHFLYHSSSKRYLTDAEIQSLSSAMPVVDKYGSVIKTWQRLLIPADGSKWAQLLDSNPWQNFGYVELGAAYVYPAYFSGETMTEEQLIRFLKIHIRASDIPSISPPNIEISVFSSPLTVQNVVLLLRWIRSLKTTIPPMFLKCIKEGCWLRTTLNGSSSYRPPSQSFDISSSWSTVLQSGSILVDIPQIDHGFYGNELKGYSQELKTVGVMFEYDEVLKYIGNHLMSVATLSSLTRENVFCMLKFIRFLKDKFPVEGFIASIREGRWLKTCRGYTSPVGSVLYTKKWSTASLLSNIPFIDQVYYGDEIILFREELKLLGVVVDFYQVSQFVTNNLKPSSQLACLGADTFLLILSLMLEPKSGDILVKTFKRVKCVKTNQGYKAPGECYLSNPSWGCILEVFSGFPVVDCDFYGSHILDFQKELKNMGVVVDFEEAVKAFSEVFRQRAAARSLTKENAISLLSSYKQLKDSTKKLPSDLKKCIHELKWLRTRLGDYRSPKDCILYGPSWESISAITLLPFIDDSNNYYGSQIHEYKKELKSMGVITDFKDGAHMVAARLYLPQDPTKITSENIHSLLNCIRTLLEKNPSLPDDFSGKVSRKWLKTSNGYRSPKESLLFIREWDSYLKPTDVPFIDEQFYTFDIKLYKRELKEIGVTVELERGCQLVSSFLNSQDQFSTMVRIYTYLNAFNWYPDTEAAARIWVPVEDSNGRWINPEKCVLFDKEDLFGLQLTVLERYYKQDLILFFSKAFKVRSNPSTDDYCKLWKSWESNHGGLSHDKCCKFWKYVTKHFNSKTEQAFKDAIVKVPVISGSDGISLFDKRDVFIGDDLQLKDLFEQKSPLPIFVWYPQPSSHSLSRTRLLEVYKKIGVRNISESVQKVESAIVHGINLKPVNPIDISIGKELIRIILGFLADPGKKIEATKRHEIVRCLLNLTVLETGEPVMINYSLSLTSGKVISVKATQLIRWERESSKLFTQKMVMSGGHKEMIEYATYFSEVISEGVLWEYGDYICALSELIKLAFVLNFDDGAVSFILKSKNLEILEEDEDFLSSAFSEQSK